MQYVCLRLDCRSNIFWTWRVIEPLVALGDKSVPSSQMNTGGYKETKYTLLPDIKEMSLEAVGEKKGKGEEKESVWQLEELIEEEFF